MLNAISLSPFLIPPNTRPVASIEGRCQLEETDQECRFQITICFEGRCAFQGALHVNDQIKTCRVELQFPLFSKRRLAIVLQKNRYHVKLSQSETKDELILLLFSEKLMKDARKYVAFLNQENLLESSHPSSVGLEASCAAEDREVKQQLLLFLIKCSGRNRSEKKPYFREFSAQVLSGAPYGSINAMAILIRMKYSFYDEDFRGVNLSQANLEGAMLYDAKLNGGNLERTRLHQTCLHHADLSEARMNQIDTGRKPTIKMPSGIRSWDISPHEHLLAIGTFDGDLVIWDLGKDVLSTSVESKTIAEGHFNCSPTYLSSLMKNFSIQFVKFIDDDRILVSDSFGFLGLWSTADSTLLSASPTIFGIDHKDKLPTDVLNEIKRIYNVPLSDWPSSLKLLNFYCYKKSANPGQDGSNDTYHFLMGHSGFNSGPEIHFKFFIQTGKIVENTITISGKSLLPSLENEINGSHKPVVYIHSDEKAFFCCLSPSGWIAGLTHNEEGRTILELKSTKDNQKNAFLIKEEICNLNFTADDLWLVGLIKTFSTSRLVRWSTDKLYLQPVPLEDILPLPEYQELFQIIGDIEQFELLLNMSYCVYAVGSVIHVRNLNTHKIVYHVEINPPYTFKLLPQKGLILTWHYNKSHFEVRKVNLAISNFPSPDYEGSHYMFFTQDSRYLITRPLNESINKCLRGEEALSHIAYEIRPYLRNLKKCLDYLLKSRFIVAYSYQEGKTYLWEARNLKLKLLSIFPKELGCDHANFGNVRGIDEGNKKLFEQLGGLNISK